MVTIYHGEALATLQSLPEASVQCVVTSPPYWGLRTYHGEPGMIGMETTFDEHLVHLVEIFHEVRRVLRDDGTLWLNYGDAYAHDGKWGGRTGGKHVAALHGPTATGRTKRTTGLGPKNLMMMPARVALALQDDGWILRSEIVWHKPNAMPEPVKDRPTSAHEKVFLFAKAPRYYYDDEAVRTQGANVRNVWTMATSAGGFRGAHFATFPVDLVERCLLAGTKPGDVVMDPFAGSGTVGLVAQRLGRDAVLIEIAEAYCAMAEARIQQDAPLLSVVRRG